MDTRGFGAPVDPLINVYASYTTEPAPMGVADYGLGPSGPYQYSTNSSLGSVTIDSLTAHNSTGYPWMTFQLNVNLQFVNAGKTYVYWVQDVAQVDTSSNTIYIIDNIWNSSAYQAKMNPGDVAGSGQVAQIGSQFFYYDVAAQNAPGNGVALVYPASLELRVNSSVDSSRQPTLTFEYDDGYGWQKYDAVVFSAVHQLTVMSGFMVDGYNYNPNGFYDSELIIGGPGGGASTTDVQSDIRLQLEYWNGHNYQLVTNAYNFGSDTAEGIQNAVSKWEYFQANGGVIADVQSGAGTLGKLWDQSGVGVVDLKTSLTSGSLHVANSSNLAGVPGEYPFSGGEVTVVLEPGSYELQVYSGASLVTAGKYPLAAGQVLQLQTPLGVVTLSISYMVVGGGTGYSPPTLTYTYDGATLTASVGGTPAVFDLDSGTSWTVSSQLPGSGSTERWETNQTAGGMAGSAPTALMTYYHQYLDPVSYSVSGGGSGYSPPSLSGSEFGTRVTLSLGTAPTSYWLDSSTQVSATDPLAGSSSTERWFAAAGQTSVSGAVSVSFAYAHQFFLTVTGGEAQSEWLASGAQVTIGEPATFGRASGTGQRVISYSLDSAAQVKVAPTRGNVTVDVTMDASHSLGFTSVLQDQVSLDSVSGQALVSITAPTVPGDSYWYDSGSAVTIILNGTWGRSATSGERLVSYSINGGAPVAVDVGGRVTVLDLASISTPQSVAASSTDQYLLEAATGSLRSITATPIANDPGWYDSQTSVTAVYDYAWNSSSGTSRSVAVAYSVDGQGATLSRRGAGTFSVEVTMDGHHAIAVIPVTQFLFTYTGGFGVTLSSPSPTGDGFYDANSTITVTSSYVGQVTPGQQRQALVGYSLDAKELTVSENATGDYTTPPIVFDGSHSLTFLTVEQSFVKLSFADASGSENLAPTSVIIDVSGSQMNVSGAGVWVDNGTAFSLSSVVWEGVDVKPSTSASYSVSGPESLTIRTRVYPASVKVVDILGFPVQGARVAATLTNGTAMSKTTNSSGLVSLGLIPIGTFQATVSSLGASTSFSGDASVHAVTASTVFLSVAVAGVAMAAVLAAVVAIFVFRRGRGKAAPAGPRS